MGLSKVRFSDNARLNMQSDDRIILLQQRLHEDDMIGHVKDIAGFEHSSFAANAQEDEACTNDRPAVGAMLDGVPMAA